MLIVNLRNNVDLNNHKCIKLNDWKWTSINGKINLSCIHHVCSFAIRARGIYTYQLEARRLLVKRASILFLFFFYRGKVHNKCESTVIQSVVGWKPWHARLSYFAAHDKLNLQFILQRGCTRYKSRIKYYNVQRLPT